ncbi:MAG: hypothetical protein HC837_20820, partial [Chloroflexaceae bacterium]|nr:hypothetical protein [Chloroflexaceae bacterium]
MIPRNGNHQTSCLSAFSRRAMPVVLALLLTVTIIPGLALFLVQPVFAAATVSGRVFQDYNNNGQFDTTAAINNDGDGTIGVAIDRGIENVVVTAYDAAGVQRGSTSTAANGTYTLNATGTGPYRIEFTNLPDGYDPGPNSAGAGTTVVFVPNGTSNNINLSLNRPDDYCQDNPYLATSCYVFGDQLSNALGQGPNVGDPVLISFPYSAGSEAADGNDANYRQPITHPVMVGSDELGTVWGMAYYRRGRSLFAAAYTKRHSGFGPDGTGAIYRIDVDASYAATTASLYADLNAIFGAGTAGADPHDPTDFDTDNDNIAWDAVGKSSLGGVAIDEDETTLYVINLFNRRLYALPLGDTPLTAADAGSIDSVQIPRNLPGCPARSDARPFALTYYEDTLYVGMVCSAESSQDVADLQAYVYTANPNTLAFNNTPVLTIPLNDTDYPRGDVDRGLTVLDPQFSANWNPWSPTFTKVDPNAAFIYPQPMLTSIAFDQGDMILGLRDRMGDQVGSFTLSNPDDATERTKGITGGDMLRACGDPDSGWTLEDNARCDGNGAGDQNSNQGPGGGEFYFRDEYRRRGPPPLDPPLAAGDEYGRPHQEVSMGSVIQIPGFPDAVFTVMDPIILTGLIDRGGTRWFANDDGNYTKAYEIYSSPTPPTPPPTFGKANGLGDLVALCDAAPVELGNRIWDDTDGDGIQDPDESGLANVEVELWEDTDGDGTADTLVGTTTTDANGEFYFNDTNITNGIQYDTAYEIRVDTTQTAISTPGYVPTEGHADSSANGTSRDSDGVLSGTNVVIEVTTGGPGENDHTLDLGFSVPVSVGDLVWFDTNNNGLVDTNEVGVEGVTVELYADTNGNGVYDEGTDTLIETQTTDSDGNYLFDELSPGSYLVILPESNFDTGGALEGYYSSTGTTGSSTGPYEPAPSPNNNINDDDNGTREDGVGVVSTSVDLRPGQEPTNDGDTDANSNLTVDFGFYTLSLGNLVWEDANNNGVVDSGEAGIAGVTVNLYDSDGNLVATTTTDSNGNYLFTGLNEGDYTVEIETPAGYISSSGTNGSTSGDYEPAPDPNDDEDDDDNGTTDGSVIRSDPITLEAGNEPDVDNASGTSTNLTVDFGLYQPASLGDYVWDDIDRDGIQDTNEEPVAGVTVNLYDGDGNLIATTTTDANGNYLFDNLTAGDYQVEFELPDGYAFTQQQQGSNSSVDSDVDPDTGFTETISLDAGENDLTWDAGLYRPLSLGNRVWYDDDN